LAGMPLAGATQAILEISARTVTTALALSEAGEDPCGLKSEAIAGVVAGDVLTHGSRWSTVGGVLWPKNSILERYS
jgi:hypothetical protein